MQQNAVFLNMNHAKYNNMQWGILLLRNRIQVAKCNRMHQTSKYALPAQCNNLQQLLELVHSVAFSRVRVNAPGWRAAILQWSVLRRDTSTTVAVRIRAQILTTRPSEHKSDALNRSPIAHQNCRPGMSLRSWPPLPWSWPPLPWSWPWCPIDILIF